MSHFTSGGPQKAKQTCMLCVDQGMEHFQKRLARSMAVKRGGHVKRLNTRPPFTSAIERPIVFKTSFDLRKTCTFHFTRTAGCTASWSFCSKGKKRSDCSDRLDRAYEHNGSAETAQINCRSAPMQKITFLSTAQITARRSLQVTCLS